ncbi:hypothetical protein CfE428DRAFT_2976 [Chthoniobacter flavus Ellin428]|uniref:Glycosyltransferase RgtA/B/C/D-like domain-containing protein n=1 Tax=Chthoniobacter flavus Ellin428 TaxID=497964 RepID=B4D251_9BACT|nr:glycosyltransferase family 39 protein [Chthoniobacter flavus]EDY19291.1 hypothetical protein CfE428DRAFT_2976 [Chthoniobacter flavus Ellin428]TCO90576.1 dolichyl-phosphate-mannose-protein mannosyltransferase [Chthoniobacter flavus]
MSSFSRPADSLPVDSTAREAASAARSAKLTRTECLILALALILLAGLRWFSVTSHRWNSDESQHLHVVWAWTVGKLQYRDIFDNHTPLFHILNAPLLRWLGERADIVLPMRRAMMPLFAIGVWCIYRLGATLYDRRTGWFAALIGAFLPAFFYRMGEFRTDVLWTILWLATLAVGLSGRLTPGRTFAAALLLGAAFSVSMKSTLLVLCLAVAGIITWLLAGRPISKAWPAHLIAFIVGVVIVPGAIVAYFASQGALEPLYYCVIKHNTMAGNGLGKTITKQLLSQSTLWLIPTIFLTRAMLPGVRQDPERGYRRLFLFLVAGTYYSLLRGFWPVVTTQDYIPWLPLLPIFAVAGITWASDWTAARFHWKLPWLLIPTLLLLGEIVWIVREEPPFTVTEKGRIASLSTVLRLTDPGEYVFDLKGESIFRPRPTRLVFETLTRDQILTSRLVDDTIPRLIETRTAVTRPSKRMMDPTKQFLKQNYISVEGCCVLGLHLPVEQNKPLTFNLVIPERYALFSQNGPVTAMLDGQPYDGPRQLAAGKHEVTVTSPDPTGNVTLVWARALERGSAPKNNSGEAFSAD